MIHILQNNKIVTSENERILDAITFDEKGSAFDRTRNALINYLNLNLDSIIYKTASVRNVKGITDNRKMIYLGKNLDNQSYWLLDLSTKEYIDGIIFRLLDDNTEHYNFTLEELELDDEIYDKLDILFDKLNKKVFISFEGKKD